MPIVMSNCMPDFLLADIQLLVYLFPNIKSRYFVISQPFTSFPLLDFVKSITNYELGITNWNAAND